MDPFVYEQQNSEFIAALRFLGEKLDLFSCFKLVLLLLLLLSLFSHV